MGRTKEQRQLDKEGKRRCIMCDGIKSKIEYFRIRRYYYNPDDSIKYVTYDSRCKECMGKYSRMMKTRSPKAYCNYTVKHLKFRAKKGGFPFDLTGKDLFNQWEKQNGRCFYTDTILDLKLELNNRKSPHRLFPSVDKQDPKLGYVNGNIIWCIYVVNRMKSDLRHSEFVDFCSTVFNKFGDRDES